MKSIVRLLALAALLFAVEAKAQTDLGCYTASAISATGRTLLFTSPQNIVFSASYYTTGSPASVSVAIESGNVTSNVSTPFGKIAALTNTTAAKFDEVTGSERYWYVNVATLSGGTSPTVIVSYCARAVSSITISQSSGISGTALTFEGSSADDYETTLSISDPTADRTVTFPDAGGTTMLSTLSSNAPDAANSVTGASNALVFEGATADADELSLSPTDVTEDVTATLPGGNNAAYAFMASSLTSNDVQAANGVWGASNALVFEGATADASELTVAPTDVGGDVTVTIPGGGNASQAFMTSLLTTNDVGVANSVWGVSGGFAAEGSSADGNEATIAFTDPTADNTITFADAAGTVMLSSLATNGVDKANAVTGASNGLVFEGATADAFETTVASTDVGADVTLTLPGGANSSMALIGSALTTNDVDAANSVWGVSNGIRLEGATADANETTISPTDVGSDITVTVPGGANASLALIGSTLTTNDMDVANSVWGSSNGINFEGSAADGSETTLSATNPTSDRSVVFADAGGTVMLSSLATNGADAANAVTGTSNGLLFEGASADTSETTVTLQDPSADRTVTIPNASGAMNVGIVTDVVFCGQQANNGTIYMSPVRGFPEGAEYANAASYIIGGAGCDTEDSATEGTADEILYANNALKILGMVCKVSSSGSNGVTLNLRSAEGDLSPDVTITIATTNTTGATNTSSTTDVAAGATMALKVVNTEDLSTGDAWCIAKVLIVP